jgi:hypothetical protein
MIAYQQLDRINKFSGFVETEWTWQIFAFNLIPVYAGKKSIS